MRQLNTGDGFKMARIIKTADIRNEIVKLVAEGKKKGADTETIGIEAFMAILEGCSNPELEKQFYGLFAGITEKGIDMIESQSLETTINDFKTILEQNNIKNFISAASRLKE